MKFPATQMPPSVFSSLRLRCVYPLVIVFLLSINGCGSLQRPALQPGPFTYEKTGIASCYAKKHQNRPTASGEIFNNNLMTAAHRTLPFGTSVVVKNVDNGKSVQVTINDRGPFIKGRIIDLSRAAFAKIENINRGVTTVEIRVVQ